MQHAFPRLTIGRMRLRKWWRGLFVIAALCGGAAVVGGLWLFYYIGWAWSFDMKKVTAMSAASIIYDRHGYVLQRFFEENRLPVAGDQIPNILEQAIIAAEDQRFYWHFGFDPFGIIRAACGNLLGSRVTSGASTITQQLARNSAQMFERTLDRKLKELFLAVRLETCFSKDEILVLYLNRIFFGRDIYGIGAAAQGYFGKEPKDLTLSECAMLAGVISGPNSFSPWRNPEKAKQVRARVLDRMAKEKFITPEQAAKSKEEPLVLRPLIELPASYVVAALWDEWPDFLPRELALRGGLRIYSTVDAAFQNAAEVELENGLQEIEKMQGYRHPRRADWLRKKTADTSPHYLQGAFVAIHNADGGILAMVGGRNYLESTFNRAVESKRQVGSTLKPFVYAHLFDALHATAFTEVPSEKFDLHHPEQAFEGTSSGPFLSVRRALEMSNNFCAMRAGLAAGVNGFVDLVDSATGEHAPPYPSSFLGACALSPLELTKAYSVFPNKGVLIQPHLIDRIETADGTVLFEHEQVRRRILSPEVSFQIHHLLEGVV
ncbi:MAG: transglycosylase domain-containing protein, partial [bacterium]